MAETITVTETNLTIMDNSTSVTITAEESSPEIITIGEVVMTGSPAPFLNATKNSATDAGTQGHMAYDDDYLYVCTTGGLVGAAIWKKTPLLRT